MSLAAIGHSKGHRHHGGGGGQKLVAKWDSIIKRPCAALSTLIWHEFCVGQLESVQQILFFANRFFL